MTLSKKQLQIQKERINRILTDWVSDKVELHLQGECDISTCESCKQEEKSGEFTPAEDIKELYKEHTKHHEMEGYPERTKEGCSFCLDDYYQFMAQFYSMGTGRGKGKGKGKDKGRIVQ